MAPLGWSPLYARFKDSNRGAKLGPSRYHHCPPHTMDIFTTTIILEHLAAPILPSPSIPIENSSHPHSHYDDADELPVPIDEERYGVGVTNSWCTIS